MLNSGIKDFVKIKNVDLHTDNVYGRNQALKAINQKKKDDDDNRLQRIIENDNPEKHIVNILPGTERRVPEAFKEAVIDKKSVGKRILDKRKRNNSTTNYNATTNTITRIDKEPPMIDLYNADPLELLNNIPNTNDPKHKLGHKTTFLIMVWFYHQGGTFEQFDSLSRTHFTIY